MIETLPINEQLPIFKTEGELNIHSLDPLQHRKSGNPFSAWILVKLRSSLIPLEANTISKTQHHYHTSNIIRAYSHYKPSTIEFTKRKKSRSSDKTTEQFSSYYFIVLRVRGVVYRSSFWAPMQSTWKKYSFSKSAKGFTSKKNH